MTADAFATAFMVMGLKKSIDIASGTSGIGAYLIYDNKEGQLSTFKTSNIAENFAD